MLGPCLSGLHLLPVYIVWLTSQPMNSLTSRGLKLRRLELTVSTAMTLHKHSLGARFLASCPVVADKAEAAIPQQALHSSVAFVWKLGAGRFLQAELWPKQLYILCYVAHLPLHGQKTGRLLAFLVWPIPWKNAHDNEPVQP